MSRPKLLLALVLLGLVPRLGAQSSASFQIARHSVDAGAAPAGSASFTLRGTVGQPDAAAATSASYTLSGGFHRPAGATPPTDPVFADGFE